MFFISCLGGFGIFRDIKSIVIEMKEDIKEFRSQKEIEGGKNNG